MALVVVAISAYDLPRSELLVGALGWYRREGGVVVVGLVPTRMREWVVRHDNSLPDQNQRRGGPQPARTKIQNS